MPERSVIREIEGYPRPDVRVNGLSVHVLDRMRGFRCVATFRTEDYRGGIEQRRGHVRRRAEQRRAELESARA